MAYLWIIYEMIRASGWGISVPEPLIWLLGVFIKVCLFLCLVEWGGPPPLHPASGGSSWVRGHCSIMLLQESGSWVWDCGITRPSGRRVPGRFLSVMFRPYHPPPLPPLLFSVKEKRQIKKTTQTHTQPSLPVSHLQDNSELTPNAVQSSLMEMNE